MHEKNRWNPDLLMRFGVLGVAAIGLVLVAHLVMVVPFGRGAWDFIFILDGAYRISTGLTPHIDFNSPIGSLSLYAVVFVQLILPELHPFVGMHVAIWFLMVPAFAVLAPRFASNAGFLAALALGSFIALLPMTLDTTHLSEISYFASYNRFASAFLFMGGLWLVLPKRNHDWLMLVYILLVLFFLKITAAFLFFLIVIAAVILGRCGWKQGIFALLALGAGLLTIQMATGLTLAYLADIAMMGAINQGRAIYAIFFSGFRNWIPLAITGGLVASALYTLHRGDRLMSRRPFHAIGVFFREEHLVIDTVLLVGAAWAAESQNTGGLGLIAALAILFHRDAWQRHLLPIGLLMAALLFPVADIAVKRSITALSREKVAASEQLPDDVFSGSIRDGVAAPRWHQCAIVE